MHDVTESWRRLANGARTPSSKLATQESARASRSARRTIVAHDGLQEFAAEAQSNWC